MPKVGNASMVGSRMWDNDFSNESARPAPRVKAEAEANYTKGQGSMGKWLNVEENLSKQYETARPVARAPTSIARNMLDKSRGTMSNFIGAGSEHRPFKVQNKHPGRVVKQEADEIAQGHKGRATTALLTRYGDLTPSARPVPRLKDQSAEIAEGHKGRATASLFHDYGCLSVSTRVPRVKPEAEETAYRHQKGSGVDKLIHMQRTTRSARPNSSRSYSSDDMFNPRPKSPEERKLESYHRRNGTTFQTEWK